MPEAKEVAIDGVVLGRQPGNAVDDMTKLRYDEGDLF